MSEDELRRIKSAALLEEYPAPYFQSPKYQREPCPGTETEKAISSRLHWSKDFRGELHDSRHDWQHLGWHVVL